MSAHYPHPSSFPFPSFPPWQRKMRRRGYEERSRVRVLKVIVISSYSSAENNLFLVKRLIQRTDMRNPDPGAKRYTSLAWAAALGHEETFEFLLTAGHDDEELSRVCFLPLTLWFPAYTLSARMQKITRSSCFSPISNHHRQTRTLPVHLRLTR